MKLPNTNTPNITHPTPHPPTRAAGPLAPAEHVDAVLTHGLCPWARCEPSNSPITTPQNRARFPYIHRIKSRSITDTHPFPFFTLPSRQFDPSRLRVRLFLLLSLLLTTLVACDTAPKSDTQKTSTRQAETTPTVQPNPWTLPDAPTSRQDLENPAPFQTFSLTLSESALYPRCHQIFEPNAKLQPWPWISEASVNAAQEAAALYGCGPEAYDPGSTNTSGNNSDGTRYIAYGVPNTDKETPNDASNLRLVAYAPDGTVRWHYLLDRSEQALNFAANFRGSFIAHPSEKLVCVGTLWEGGTQTACIDHTTPLSPDAEDPLAREPVWTGSMNFWAGTRPIGLDNSLFSADIKGITRRYPFNGVEMRHRAFEIMGGRGALYTTDPQTLYFAPAISDNTSDAILSAYDLPDMTPRWRLQLPDRPQTSYHHVAPEHDLLFIKITDTLYGIDTQKGTLRFAHKIGVDHPPIATSADHIYLLLRRPEHENLIYQLDPRDGRVLQVTTAPTGTLDLALRNNLLLLRSVRAVRTAQLP